MQCRSTLESSPLFQVHIENLEIVIGNTISTRNI